MGDGDGGGEGDDAGGVLRITDWMRNRLGSSLAAKAANFPWTREIIGPNPPPPLDACVLRAPHPTIYTDPLMFGGKGQMFDGTPQMFDGTPPMFDGTPPMFDGTPQCLPEPLNVWRTPQMFDGTPQCLAERVK